METKRKLRADLRKLQRDVALLKFKSEIKPKFRVGDKVCVREENSFGLSEYIGTIVSEPEIWEDTCMNSFYWSYRVHHPDISEAELECNLTSAGDCS